MAPVRRLIPIALIVAACGGAAGVSVDPTDTPVTTPAAVGTDVNEPGPDTTTIPDSQGPPTTASDRPVAPDFTLELNDGGSYTLSEGEKPVYLVFWAEW
jgi:hypothetical protein